MNYLVEYKCYEKSYDDAHLLFTASQPGYTTTDAIYDSTTEYLTDQFNRLNIDLDEVLVEGIIYCCIPEMNEVHEHTRGKFSLIRTKDNNWRFYQKDSIN